MTLSLKQKKNRGRKRGSKFSWFCLWPAEDIRSGRKYSCANAHCTKWSHPLLSSGFNRACKLAWPLSEADPALSPVLHLQSCWGPDTWGGCYPQGSILALWLLLGDHRLSLLKSFSYTSSSQIHVSGPDFLGGSQFLTFFFFHVIESHIILPYYSVTKHWRYNHAIILFFTCVLFLLVCYPVQNPCHLITACGVSVP